MVSVNVKLAKIDDVKLLVAAATESPFDIDLVSGRYIIDAKSIMGIFSLDFEKPIEVQMHTSIQQAEEFIEKIQNYVI